MVKAVYIHIPFCNDICSYCAFSKFYYNEKWVSLYLDSLAKEIDLYYNNKDIIETIYIGGGTPSSLSIKMLIKLFSLISKFNISENLEFSFECNFDISYEKIDILKKNNVNRLSFGIETINSNLSINDASGNLIINFYREDTECSLVSLNNVIK